MFQLMKSLQVMLRWNVLSDAASASRRPQFPVNLQPPIQHSNMFDHNSNGDISVLDLFNYLLVSVDAM